MKRSLKTNPVNLSQHALHFCKSSILGALSAVGYLQNVIPSLLVENIILEVFPVHLLRLLDLRRSHYLSWRGESRGVTGGRYIEFAVVIQFGSIACVPTRRLCPLTLASFKTVETDKQQLPTCATLFPQFYLLLLGALHTARLDCNSRVILAQ